MDEGPINMAKDLYFYNYNNKKIFVHLVIDVVTTKEKTMVSG